MYNLRSIGTEAEDKAANYLLQLGYTILQRRYRTRNGEIDIVAFDNNVLVFIEVKYRMTDFQIPEESVTQQKQINLINAAEKFIHDHNLHNHLIRFDLIAIDKNGLRHHQSFFES